MKAIMRIVLAVSRLVINVILILNIMHSLKGGYRDFFYSFIGPVGHSIWWENSRNGSFGPKNDLKMHISPFFRSIFGSKFLIMVMIVY